MGSGRAKAILLLIVITAVVACGAVIRYFFFGSISEELFWIQMCWVMISTSYTLQLMDS